MRKIASILVIVFAFTLTTQAQQKRRQQKGPEMSIEQRTELMAKQLMLTLDLSEKQKNQILPLLKAQAAEKKVAMDKKKEMQKTDTKPTADQIFEMKSKILDQRIAFKTQMKKILNDDQMEKFSKMAKGRKMKRMEMMKQKMGQQKGQQMGKQKGQQKGQQKGKMKKGNNDN